MGIPYHHVLFGLALIALSTMPANAHYSYNLEDNPQPLSCTSKQNTINYAPGDTIPRGVITSQNYKQWFWVTAIPDVIFNQMKGRSFADGCTTGREDLRYIRCLHMDVHGNTIVGEMVLNKKIAQKVADILLKLYEAHYPIERMRLIDNWEANDEQSMRANNTSGFCYRRVAGSSFISLHSKGLAIDINTLYNPYYKVKANGTTIIQPSTAKPYVNRNKQFNYKIVKGDLCYQLFIANGFRWGGDWKKSKDYQHFEYQNQE